MSLHSTILEAGETKACLLDHRKEKAMVNEKERAINNNSLVLRIQTCLLGSTTAPITTSTVQISTTHQTKASVD
jgi:hypothetical protein